MKIIHLTNNYIPYSYGGIETVIKTLIDNIEIQQDVISIAKENEVINYKKSKIFFFKRDIGLSSANISINKIFHILELINSYDKIIVHSPAPYFEFLINFIKIEKTNIICYHHSDIIRQKFLYYIYKPFQIKFLNKVGQFIFSTNNYYKYSNIRKYINNKKIHIMPYGIKKNNKYKKVKLEYENYVLFLGALRTYKGIEYLLKANKENQFNLIICGKDIYGKLKKVDKSKYNFQHFENLDNEEKNYLIKKSDFLILPSISKNEAFGIVILEAFSQKKTIITTELNTGTSSINRNNRTGLVILPKNSDEIINSIIKLKSHIQTRKKLEKSAFSDFVNKYDYKIYCDNFLKILSN